jgi:AcrR family transcriptional regulator
MARLTAVARWADDANGRLRAAAMQLYVERGFDDTTVADIAARAGVTARTFFRHFADKREVLFAGSSALQEALVAALGNAPPDATPMQAVAAALDAAGEILGGDRERSRQRQAIINSHADLLERELIKLARLAGALAEGLRHRGVPEPDAGLAAEAGIVVLRVAFGRWAGPDGKPLVRHGDGGSRDDDGDRGSQNGSAEPEVSLKQMLREDLARLSEVAAGARSAR